MRSLHQLLLCGATICASVVFADVHVNQDTGNDQSDGQAPERAVKTLHRAVAIRKPADRIIIHNTTTPYRESLELIGQMGTPDQPLVIEGNGAVLEGLVITQPREWKDEGKGIISTAWGADWGFTVVADGKEGNRAASLDKMEPGESFGDYTAHRGYYRLLPSQSIDKTRLETPRGFCGVCIDDSSHIIIRNLICQYFWNDGFNIQGDSQDIRLEDIVGRFNGDEGVSAHGTADVTVIGADLHHNDNGLCDTVMSRTRYVGLNVHENRSVGVWFQGGDHTIVNARIVNNPSGVTLEEGQGPKHLPGFEKNPDVNCRLALRNTLVRDGAFGIKLAHHSQVVLDHVTILDQPIGIALAGEGVYAHVTNSIVAAGKHAIEGNGRYWGDYNAWGDATVFISGQPKRMKDWASESGVDSHSAFVDPKVLASGELQSDSPVIGKAYVDERYYESLKHDGFWSDAHPPRVHRDPGVDARALWTRKDTIR
jgi:hypothetical protein